MFFLVSCVSTTRRKVNKQLTSYRILTEYILCKNLHNNFEHGVSYEMSDMKLLDNDIYTFMKENEIFLIRITPEANSLKKTKSSGRIVFHFLHFFFINQTKELWVDIERNLNGDFTVVKSEYVRY